MHVIGQDWYWRTLGDRIKGHYLCYMETETRGLCSGRGQQWVRFVWPVVGVVSDW